MTCNHRQETKEGDPDRCEVKFIRVFYHCLESEARDPNTWALL